MKRPQKEEYAPFYHTYISKVPDDVIAHLENQAELSKAFFSSLSEEKMNYAYAPGKWTIKQVLGHLIDTERIFSYRALRIARNDKTDLPGFDENLYAQMNDVTARTSEDMVEEFYALRRCNLTLFKSFGETELTRNGSANTYNITVRAILFSTAGHELHHIEVIKERYL